MTFRKANKPASVLSKDSADMTLEDLQYLQNYEMDRRDFMLDVLAKGGLAAAFGMSSAASWANIQPPEDEVNLQIMPPPDMPPALAAKKIDAFIVAEPFNAAGELLAGGSMLRFTGDMWRNHPCCVVCMNEDTVKANPTWTQKVMNAIVKAQIYAQSNKKEVAHLLSRDGEGYLPMKANVVERAMTLYDDETYASPDAIHNPEWGSGRIDFQPWPFPSATKLIVNELKNTLVGGDAKFIQELDADFVVKDLVDYDFVKVAMEKHQGWKDAPGFDANNPFDREEVISL